MARGVVALVFRCDTENSSIPSTTREAAQIRWISTMAVRELCTQTYTKRITHALADEPAIARTHDGQ
jgi:hypothetical protein